MNQGKLEVVKEETARVNILGTSKLKWREYVNLIQMTIISTTVGKNPLKEMKQLIVNERVRNAVLGCSLKNNRMISVRLQGKPFSITVIQVHVLPSNAEEAEVEWL